MEPLGYLGCCGWIGWGWDGGGMGVKPSLLHSQVLMANNELATCRPPPAIILEISRVLCRESDTGSDAK